jgi:hypothetical protein
VKLKGTAGSDWLYGGDDADLIRGRGGFYDDLRGYGGEDRLYGDAGDDYLNGGDGDDTLRGGSGDDVIHGQIAGGEALPLTWDADQLYGGTGYDNLFGSGLLVGGKDNDVVMIAGGEGYGDEGPGLVQRVAGADWLATNTGWNPYTATTHTGGLGADTFDWAMYFDGVASRGDVLDFAQGEDRIQYRFVAGPFVLYGDELLNRLDGNDDGLLTAGDGGDAGWVASDAAANTITIAIGDGDMLTVHGATVLGRADFTEWLT